MDAVSLNIKNEEVHALVRRLAELTGQSQTSAVEDAVRRRLQEVDAEKETRRAEKLAAIERIVENVRRLPVVGPTYDEIMEEMYDENGLPR